MIRIATRNDIPEVKRIYDNILRLEAEGKAQTGWQKDVYPTEETALDALSKNELFVFEEKSHIAAAARINQEQLSEYASCHWKFAAPENEVMVIHTLVVDPEASGSGIGSKFVRFYEEFALKNGCRCLRLDTNATNEAARSLYKKLGFVESGIISCEFNGIKGVSLVCLEKCIHE